MNSRQRRKIARAMKNCPEGFVRMSGLPLRGGSNHLRRAVVKARVEA